MMKKILIYGACSAIATATARLFAENGAELMFIASNATKLEALIADFGVRYGKKPKYLVHNATDIDTLKATFDKAIDILGDLDVILIAHGVLPDQEKAEQDIAYLHKISIINGNSVIYLSQLSANYMQEKKTGTIAVISSVAGDRGRYSNYAYGASKGFVTTFLQGLRNKMAHCGVNVLTIKPGFVDTPMTAHLNKNFLFASADEVGKDIFKAILKGKGQIYSKPIWKLIMIAVIHTPSFIFNKMKM